MARLSGVISKPESLQGVLSIKNVEGAPSYSGETIIVPATFDQTLETKNTIVRDDILVKEIPTFETSNEYGVTFIIAS